MKIKIYKGADGDWHIRISGRNNRKLLDASGYNTRKIALASLRAVIKNFKSDNYSIK